MKTKINEDVRRHLYNNRITQWEVANVLGVHENTVLRWLRRPLTPEQRTRIDDAIATILKNRGEGS